MVTAAHLILTAGTVALLASASGICLCRRGSAAELRVCGLWFCASMTAGLAALIWSIL